ncbi:acetolactate synthase 3 large subunit [Vibrio breoganii]|uniref:acetolactate synthase 3 large subunit n=1 Tax=Vibrio breoganii TaxID=553239 RepID=UPI000C81F270|nr:acetolactate synthase 3 large subunit [Vibrio breoganii]PMG32387.1 acetolactate synthase, large subunit, biosynthetic type [Vibrio breoganii]PMG95016.1 acetolactate synthase, large subunit, biosynthetic type [Vibrio breoganii]PMI24000.1 acetolactate synthase, large subunit, biosynthetic type [Vibrio breoganii]PML41152.1 acetolactate synthase, large subunit, biosynthetic type [Vibrio breoganii]PML64324.1 acetolactate synthase, large subunit, biosynthetic type [Vibrio breoganii]
MKMLSGAEMIVQSLIEEEVEQIFGYPGGSVLDIYDALHAKTDKIKHVLVRHEQAATHMADGYARSTGKPGVVLVCSGPGATNTVTGIATAYMDSIPMIVISGNVPNSLIGNDAFQECDIVGVSRPIVKHSFLVKRAEDIAETVKKAFFIASTGRPGPVVIDVPKDVMNPQIKLPYEYPESIKMRSYNPTTSGHKGQIKKALKALLEAKKPVLYVGGGAVISESDQYLISLAEKLNLPVVSTLMGLGAFPGMHSNSLGMLGMHGTYEANMAMHNADLIFGVGVRFDDRTTNNLEKYCPDAKFIHVDIDPSSVSKNVRADLPIVGSADKVLECMVSLLENQNSDNDKEALDHWWSEIATWRERQCLAYEKSPDKIKPQQVIETLHKLTDGDAYVASDVGQHQMFAALYYPFKQSRRWINSGGLGTMGFGLPAGMGVKFAHPEEEVVVVTGDGSIQMNIQELSTALQYGIPVKIINLNNRFLGMVKQWQDIIYEGRHSNSYMTSVPDFAAIAEAYGHVGIRISSPDELESGLQKALDMKDRLVFVDISVDETEHVYPMQVKGEGMDNMWLSKTERT